jgi:erythronate-4-phosphate dehydrogenase
MSKPAIIIDDAIPFIRGVFEPYANVCYSKGSDFSPKNADILITRTRTKCNASLLDGTLT